MEGPDRDVTSDAPDEGPAHTPDPAHRAPAASSGGEGASDAAADAPGDTAGDTRAEGPATGDEATNTPVGGGATDAAGAPSAGDLQEALDAANARADEYLGRLKRLQADFDNFRKRKRREVEDARRRGGERLLGDLLDVVDTFDRALDGASGGDESLHDGVSLIYKQLRALLAREGVERIQAEGHPFDPEVHEAVMREETDAYDDGVVIKELEKGYMLKGRVIRPAKVKVAAQPSSKDPSGS